MKNLQSYEYEKKILEFLKEEYNKDNDAFDNSDFYAQKALAEKVIGMPITVYRGFDGKGGVQGLGVDVGYDAMIFGALSEDNPQYVSVDKYLDDLHTICHIGEVFGKTLLEDDGKVTGGIAYVGETLAEFIDDHKESYNFRPTPDSKYKVYDYEKINQALYDCGIKPLRYDGGERFVPITDKEQTVKYAIHRYGDGEITVNLPKKEVWRGETQDPFHGRFYGESAEKLEALCDEPKITIPRYILGEFLNDGVDIDEFLYGNPQMETESYTVDDTDGLVDFIRENYPSFDYYAHSNIEACASKLHDTIQKNIAIEKGVGDKSTDNPDYVRIELSANAVIDMYDTSGTVRSIIGDKYYVSNDTLKLDIPRTYANMYLSNIDMFENGTAINPSQADKYVWDKLPKWFSEQPFKDNLRDYEVARNDIRFASGYDIYGSIRKQVEKEYGEPITTIKKSDVVMDKKPSNTQIKE